MTVAPAATRTPSPASIGARLRDSRFFVVLLLVWLGARAYVIAGGYRIGVSYDTFSYAYRGELFYDRGPLVSFTGAAPRLWGTPLFFAAFANDTQRVMAQFAVSTLAYGLLAWALWVHLRHPAVRILAAGSVFVIALMRPVTAWDFAVLAESLSISVGVLTLAALLLWLARGSWWWWATMVTAAFWWLFIRAELRFAVGALMAALVLYAVLRPSRGVRRKQAITAVLILLLGIGWVSAITPRVNRTFQLWSSTHFVQEEEIFSLRALYKIYPDPNMRRAYTEMGMPDCPEARQYVGPGPDLRHKFMAAYAKCVELRQWARAHGNLATVEFVLREPAAFARQFQSDSRMLVADTPVVYATSRQVLPASVETAVFPPQTGARIIVTFWGGLLLAVALALASGAVRRRPAATWVFLGTVAVGVGMLLFADMFLATEPVRFGCQESILCKLATIALVALSVDTIIERRQR